LIVNQSHWISNFVNQSKICFAISQQTPTKQIFLFVENLFILNNKNNFHRDIYLLSKKNISSFKKLMQKQKQSVHFELFEIDQKKVKRQSISLSNSSSIPFLVKKIFYH
jgi:hypothetical protein